jgi:5-methylcytosine-specific restriction enzyme A
MARREFPVTVRRAAVKRSGMKCEATGTDYGLAPDQRCGGELGSGFDYDHIIADSIGGEPSLDNCAVVCKRCHGVKTRTVDTPRAAKTKRQADLAAGIRKPSTLKRPKGVRFDWSLGRYVKESRP